MAQSCRLRRFLLTLSIWSNATTLDIPVSAKTWTKKRALLNQFYWKLDADQKWQSIVFKRICLFLRRWTRGTGTWINLSIAWMWLAKQSWLLMFKHQHQHSTGKPLALRLFPLLCASTIRYLANKSNYNTTKIVWNPVFAGSWCTTKALTSPSLPW